ncbi:SRPBCC family protein [Flavobacteriaceae bacterium]|nr:SRPBCC family protein [Flavobacteriaceae bacterium]
MVIALFVDNDYNVENGILIQQPKAVVFDYVKSRRNQDKFSKWANIDPNIKKSYSGTDRKVGFVSAWESDHPEVGKGEQEIIKITEGQRIDFEFRFFEPFAEVYTGYMITEAVSATETKVRWGFDGRMDYPFNLMLLNSSFQNTMKKDFGIRLQNLK